MCIGRSKYYFRLFFVDKHGFLGETSVKTIPHRPAPTFHIFRGDFFCSDSGQTRIIGYHIFY
jgi:hypothetical protein